MNKLLLLGIIFVLTSGISCVKVAEGKTAAGETKLSGEAAVTPLSRAAGGSQKEQKSINTGKTNSKGGKSEAPDIKGSIGEMGKYVLPSLAENWRVDHEFAKDIFQQYGALTVRLRFTNISNREIPAQTVTGTTLSWNAGGWQDGPISASTIDDAIKIEDVATGKFSFSDASSSIVKPGQAFTVEKFSRIAGKRSLLDYTRYDLNLTSPPQQDEFFGNLMDGFYKETDSAAANNVVVIYKAGLGGKGLAATIAVSSPSPLTGKIFFRWLDDQLKPASDIQSKSVAVSRNLRDVGPEFRPKEFTVPLSPGLKSYEFWIEVVEKK